MVLEFAGDPTCGYLDRQYMLGESLLVAPVFSDDSQVEYYLPAGKWTNFLTGEKVEGGRWIKEKHGYLSLPLMACPNSIIAVGNVDNKPDYDFAAGVTFHIFELTAGKAASTAVFGTDGQKKINLVAKRPVRKSPSKLRLPGNGRCCSAASAPSRASRARFMRFAPTASNSRRIIPAASWSNYRDN